MIINTGGYELPLSFSHPIVDLDGWLDSEIYLPIHEGDSDLYLENGNLIFAPNGQRVVIRKHHNYIYNGTYYIEWGDNSLVRSAKLATETNVTEMLIRKMKNEYNGSVVRAEMVGSFVINHKLNHKVFLIDVPMPKSLYKRKFPDKLAGGLYEIYGIQIATPHWIWGEIS